MEKAAYAALRPLMMTSFSGPGGSARGGLPTYIGVDAGGSRSRAVLLDASLRALLARNGAPVNASRLDCAEAARRLGLLIRELLGQDDAIDSPSMISCGVAGAGTDSCRRELARALRLELPSAKVHVVADVEAVLESVHPQPDPVGTVVIIAGTGSIAAGRSALGTFARCGGRGLTTGDPGSGAWFGLRALRIPSLHERLRPEAEAAGLGGLQQAASLFPVILRAAREGEPCALELLAEGAHELAAQAVSVIRDLGLAGRSFPVALWGGVFRAGPLITGPLSDNIRDSAPGARLVRPADSPEVGAVRLAMKEERSESQ
ncbi:MAG: BadF/BadG/BcrA/BcrD ATPase family protein [Planctomycetota bacterium]